MNLLDAANLTALILNFNDGQTDQDFTPAHLRTAINQAYNEEVIEMAENGLMENLKTTYEFVWPAGESTLVLPSSVDGKQLLLLANVGADSDLLLFSAYGLDSDLFWKDRRTMQWGVSGPTSDTTIRAIYLATAETLITDSDVPKLIPEQFQPLLCWSAACWLKDVAEETSPAIWLARLQRSRERLWKFMSKGKPTSDPPAIKQWRPINGGSDG